MKAEPSPTYGLPWRRAFCRQFWQGAAISFASLTGLLAVLRVAGAFSFGPLSLGGAEVWKYGALWAVPLFLAALFEDHLLTASFHGPLWLTGGVFGPEASWLNLLVLVMWWFLFAAWLHGVKYPNPRSLAADRR